MAFVRLEGKQALRAANYTADGDAEELIAANRTWAEIWTAEVQDIGAAGIAGGRGPIVPVRPAIVNIATAGVAGVEEIIREAAPHFGPIRTARSTKLYAQIVKPTTSITKIRASRPTITIR